MPSSRGGAGLDYAKWDHIRTDEEEKKRDEQKVRAVPEEPRRKRDTVGKTERQPFVNHGLRVPPASTAVSRLAPRSRSRATRPPLAPLRRRWEEGRAKWLEVSPNRQPARRHPPVDDDLIYDTIFSKPMGWLLPHPARPPRRSPLGARRGPSTRAPSQVPLAHMVELLEDEWSD